MVWLGVIGFIVVDVIIFMLFINKRRKILNKSPKNKASEADRLYKSDDKTERVDELNPNKSGQPEPENKHEPVSDPVTNPNTNNDDEVEPEQALNF